MDGTQNWLLQRVTGGGAAVKVCWVAVSVRAGCCGRVCRACMKDTARSSSPPAPVHGGTSPPAPGDSFCDCRFCCGNWQFICRPTVTCSGDCGVRLSRPSCVSLTSAGLTCRPRRTSDISSRHLYPSRAVSRRPPPPSSSLPGACPVTVTGDLRSSPSRLPLLRVYNRWTAQPFPASGAAD